MKKSAKLQLVLITAAFASCDQKVIPSRSPSLATMDPAMAAATIGPSDPGYGGEDLDYGIYPAPDTLFPYNPWYANLNLNIDFSRLFSPRNGYYNPRGQSYQRGAFWRNRVFISRGGFGKSAYSSVAS